MAAGRGSIATSSRVSCIRLTTDATPTAKPIPSFGSRRPLPRLRSEILRRRRGRNARAVARRPPALPDAPSAVVHSLAADRCAALPQASSRGAADRRRPCQTSFVARMSEAISGAALTPSRISLRSSGLQAGYRRMGRAKRNPSPSASAFDGYRFRLRSLSYGGQVAPPILRDWRITPPAARRCLRWRAGESARS
jgi:hypothetical protein